MEAVDEICRRIRDGRSRETPALTVEQAWDELAACGCVGQGAQVRAKSTLELQVAVLDRVTRAWPMLGLLVLNRMLVDRWATFLHDDAAREAICPQRRLGVDLAALLWLQDARFGRWSSGVVAPHTCDVGGLALTSGDARYYVGVAQGPAPDCKRFAFIVPRSALSCVRAVDLGTIEPDCHVHVVSGSVDRRSLLAESACSVTDVRWLAHERQVLFASTVRAMAEAAFDAVAQYCTTRRAFGKPICEHQAVAIHLANMSAELALARVLVWDLAAATSRRIVRHRRETWRLVEETAINCAVQAVQLRGGHGYVGPRHAQRWLQGILGVVLVARARVDGGLLSDVGKAAGR